MPVRTLDDLVEIGPTFIKMDIEGAELDTLAGAEPCSDASAGPGHLAYHAQDHLWRIPLTIAAMAPEYRFYCAGMPNGNSRLSVTAFRLNDY